jgi:hypothetical protein
MKTHPIAGICVALAALAAAQAQPEVIYDSNGFSGFDLGPISNAPGWYGYGWNASPSGPKGAEPEVVDLPDGNRCVQFYVPDAYTALSYMQISWSPPVSTASKKLRLEFDVLRQQDRWTSNFWWMLDPYQGSGAIPYGVQWDTATGVSSTFPLGWDGPSRPTVYGRFAHLDIVYDFDTRRASASYDGVAMGSAGFPLTQGLYAWSFQLAHDEATGSGPETMWVDNVRLSVIPEPASSVALIAGVLAVARLSWRRRAPV